MLYVLGTTVLEHKLAVSPWSPDEVERALLFYQAPFCDYQSSNKLISWDVVTM